MKLLILAALLAASLAEDARCPAQENKMMGICVEDCEADGSDCPRGQICCSNGCGHTCVHIPGEVHIARMNQDARCPAMEGGMGTCVHLCDVAVEGECPVGQICCSNGCGHDCVELPEGYERDEGTSAPAGRPAPHLLFLFLSVAAWIWA